MSSVVKLDPITPAWIGKISINRMRLNAIEVRPGWSGHDLDELEKIFSRELKDRREFKAKGERAPDGLTPNEWLRVNCYQAILAWLTIDEGADLFDRLRQRFVRGTQKPDRDIFQLGIVGIFAKSPKLISGRDRERLAAPMWYAFRHYIPPYLLIGFNGQYPSHLTGHSAWRQQIEPALYEWVVEQRAAAQLRECPLDHFRGRYSKCIEDGVAAELKRHDRSNDDEW